MRLTRILVFLLEFCFFQKHSLLNYYKNWAVLLIFSSFALPRFLVLSFAVFDLFATALESTRDHTDAGRIILSKQLFTHGVNYDRLASRNFEHPRFIHELRTKLRSAIGFILLDPTAIVISIIILFHLILQTSNSNTTLVSVTNYTGDDMEMGTILAKIPSDWHMDTSLIHYEMTQMKNDVSFRILLMHPLLRRKLICDVFSAVLSSWHSAFTHQSAASPPNLFNDSSRNASYNLLIIAASRYLSTSEPLPTLERHLLCRALKCRIVGLATCQPVPPPDLIENTTLPMSLNENSGGTKIDNCSSSTKHRLVKLALHSYFNYEFFLSGYPFAFVASCLAFIDALFFSTSFTGSKGVLDTSFPRGSFFWEKLCIS